MCYLLGDENLIRKHRLSMGYVYTHKIEIHQHVVIRLSQTEKQTDKRDEGKMNSYSLI